MRTLFSRPTRPRTMALCAAGLGLMRLLMIPCIAVGQTQRDSGIRVGDRLIVSVKGEPTLSDTFVVHEGMVLKLPSVPDISLQGVQRSELTDRITQSVAKLYRDPEVRVIPLVRIGVLGQVMRPGYYELPADVPLTDAMMAAGGPTALGDPARTVARRGTQVLWDADAVHGMLAAGATLAQLNLHTGDDIVVEERKTHNWGTVAQVATAASSLVFSVIYLIRR